MVLQPGAPRKWRLEKGHCSCSKTPPPPRVSPTDRGMSEDEEEQLPERHKHRPDEKNKEKAKESQLPERHKHRPYAMNGRTRGILDSKRNGQLVILDVSADGGMSDKKKETGRQSQQSQLAESHNCKLLLDREKAAREKVQNKLNCFRDVCVDLLAKGERVVDKEAYRIVKDRGDISEQKILGAVPGTRVGDKYRYRTQLYIIGLHRQLQKGIDCMMHGGQILAISIVASGAYEDELQQENCLIYIGEGGNLTRPDKPPQHQELKGGNLGLLNSLKLKKPIRVIRHFFTSKNKMIYVYDGLYMVDEWVDVIGPRGKIVFKFHLTRIGATACCKRHNR